MRCCRVSSSSGFEVGFNLKATKSQHPSVAEPSSRLWVPLSGSLWESHGGSRTEATLRPTVCSLGLRETWKANLLEALMDPLQPLYPKLP